MEVKSDFFMYKSGVYRATNLAESGVAEFHSVRIVGWGEEEGEPYWVGSGAFLEGRYAVEGESLVTSFVSAVRQLLGSRVGGGRFLQDRERVQRRAGQSESKICVACKKLYKVFFLLLPPPQIEDFVVGVWARTKDYSRKMLEKRKNRIRQR